MTVEKLRSAAQGAQPITAGEQELRAALDVANIPTLLMVVAHLSGDPRWLAEPYRPTKGMAVDDNDTGGLPLERREEVRSAAFDLLMSIWDERADVPPPPAGERLTDLLSTSLGERVPPEYAQTMAEEAGFVADRGVQWTTARPDTADDMHIVIIGAGLSGVAAAATLDRLGIDYTIIEKHAAVGGVWWANDYPGAGVDTPSHLYSYSFAPQSVWSRYYAKQPEILDYIQRTACDWGIDDHLMLNTEVTAAHWNEDTQRWRIDTRAADGATATVEATAVIACTGILHHPATPKLSGAAEFRGHAFHSAEWDHSVDLTDKRVAVVGTGATSMQIVPAIADTAGHVLVFQRSPQWVVPNGNYSRDMTEATQLLMAQVPYYANFYRLRLIWLFQDKLLPTLRRDSSWPHQDRSVNAINDKHRSFLTDYIDGQLGDRTDLRPKVMPTYPPYGKRILIDNRWYKTLQRENVGIVAEGVAGFEADCVVTTDGNSYPVDIVVFATGFKVSESLVASIDVRGRAGAVLSDVWRGDNPWAYLGITVPGFPNFFVVPGPNTAMGHGGSSIYVAECAMTYVARMLITMAEKGIHTVDVRRKVAEDYVQRLDREHDELIWSHPGMTTWFRNKSGRVTVCMPWRGVDYWQMTQEPDLDKYVVVP